MRRSLPTLPPSLRRGRRSLALLGRTSLRRASLVSLALVVMGAFAASLLVEENARAQAAPASRSSKKRRKNRPDPAATPGNVPADIAGKLPPVELPTRAQEYGFRAGFAVLISLFVFATWNDLSHIGLFRWVAGLIGKA